MDIPDSDLENRITSSLPELEHMGYRMEKNEGQLVVSGVPAILGEKGLSILAESLAEDNPPGSGPEEKLKSGDGLDRLQSRRKGRGSAGRQGCHDSYRPSLGPPPSPLSSREANLAQTGQKNLGAHDRTKRVTSSSKLVAGAAWVSRGPYFFYLHTGIAGKIILPLAPIPTSFEELQKNLYNSW
jgi:hypothetical protein